jgi:hypothetical protein
MFDPDSRGVSALGDDTLRERDKAGPTRPFIHVRPASYGGVRYGRGATMCSRA